jgi:seryl-tRNA synthetase
MGLSSRLEALRNKRLFDNSAQAVPFKANVMDVLASRGEAHRVADGCIAYGGLFSRVLEYFDRLFADVGRSFGAIEYHYPSAIGAPTLRRAGYFESFPHQMVLASHLPAAAERLQQFVCAQQGAPETAPIAPEYLEDSGLVLNPAVCYHVYRQHEHKRLPSGATLLVTSRSKCFRRESAKGYRGLERLLDFSMREVVFIGPESFVKRSRSEAMQRVVETVVRRFGLNSWIELASDPFFVKDVESDESRRAFQLMSEAKYELKLALPFEGGDLAAASFNVHGNFFTKTFDIAGDGGEGLWTGCAAFGLERWAYGLLSQYGADPSAWPFQID